MVAILTNGEQAAFENQARCEAAAEEQGDLFTYFTDDAREGFSLFLDGELETFNSSMDDIEKKFYELLKKLQYRGYGYGGYTYAPTYPINNPGYHHYW